MQDNYEDIEWANFTALKSALKICDTWPNLSASNSAYGPFFASSPKSEENSNVNEKTRLSFLRRVLYMIPSRLRN